MSNVGRTRGGFLGSLGDLVLRPRPGCLPPTVLCARVVTFVVVVQKSRPRSIREPG